MANQLMMDKSFAINSLRESGYSERRIAQTLGVSRGVVRRHLRAPQSNSTKAPTGSRGQTLVPEPTVATIAMGSQCEPFRELIVGKCELGLSAKRIHQDLLADPATADKPEIKAVVAEHRRWLPKVDLPPAPGNAHRVLTYDKSTDEAVREGKTVRRNDPIPQ